MSGMLHSALTTAEAYKFDLGRHSRAVSTRSPVAQLWFDRGLNWCFGFHQEEGVRCFQRALDHDSECAMAHWGVAYGSGPFYNLAWPEFGPAEAKAITALASVHLARAQACLANATAVEAVLVNALAFRFQAPHPASREEYARWDSDYAAAMRRVHHAHPADLDVAALFVEALITRTPRKLWDLKSGKPAPGADVLEALSVCEAAILGAEAEGLPPHPALLHLHIHVLEMSGEPGRAMPSADRLGQLCPDAGHLNHMPGHIYALCGAYDRARDASKRAIAADDKYAAYDPGLGFYLTARCHDLHLLMHACMFLGQLQPALAAARKMRGIVTHEAVSQYDRPKLAATMEGYYSMLMHVLVRFGRWEDILAEPPPPDAALYPVSTGMHHYGRGIAFASLKRIDEAEEERRRFHESLRHVAADRRMLSNGARDVLGVAEAMLEGEVAYHKGDFVSAFDHLRESVRRDDDLGYTEPWAWMHPPRHALAALLAEQGRFQEAEAVYRDDLGLSGRVQRCAQHPGNVWSLHGLAECLQRRGEADELTGARQQLALAIAKADVPITSSCLCRLSVAATSEKDCCR